MNLEDLTIEAESDTTYRTVRLNVTAGAEPMACGTERQPRRFRPELVTLEWRNGAPYQAQVTGKRVLKDGTISLTDDGVSFFLSDGYMERAPEWVQKLVREWSARVPAWAAADARR